MRRRWDRGLALVGAAAGVVLLLSTLGFVIADGGLEQRTALLLVAGVALVVAYAVIDPAAVPALVRRRRTHFRSLSVLTSAAVVGVLVALNVLASRGPQAADLTRSGLYTLSPRSVQAVRQLDSDLFVTGFYRPDQRATQHGVQSLLDLYREQSPHVKVRFTDPAKESAAGDGAPAAGSIVLRYKTRSPIVLDAPEPSESVVTGAIVRLESSRTPIVCWAAGDGERDLRDTDEVSGYSAVAELLRTSSYRLQDLRLAQQGVTAVCDVLVLLQVGRPLGEPSVRAIHDYLARGGKLLMAVDPWLDPGVLAAANAVLQPYGAAFDGSLVVEPDDRHAATGDPTVPVVYEFPASAITNDLYRRHVFFPEATPITGTGGGATRSVDLASTTAGAYAIPLQRTDLNHRGTDRSGPFVLMRTIEQRRAAGTTRIVLAGTSALAENRTMPPAASGSNADLLLASLDWLSEQDSLIAIPPKPPAALPLTLTDSDVRLNVALALPLPVLLILAAGWLALARRRRPV